ncbi:MAG: DUF4494 domain-containing protein [Marinilabiliaceae bacterium]|nr:DUF4494 domain-containing protein [Marinilabiliaceae bacterium]
MSHFEVKVKYRKICEKSGKEITARESYLTDGASFGDAEEKVFKQLESLVSGEIIVTGISRANYSAILSIAPQRWFRCRVSYPAIDDSTGNVKKITQSILVGAATIDDASEYLKKDLESITVDYDILSVVESPIVDIFLNLAS